MTLTLTNYADGGTLTGPQLKASTTDNWNVMAAMPFVTTAADSDLSAETAIYGLAGSPDRYAAGGAGTNEEWSTVTTGLTWDSTPPTCNSHTTIPSYLYMGGTVSTDQLGTKAWAPAGAFDARLGGINLAYLGGTAGVSMTLQIGLHVGDATNANRAETRLTLYNEYQYVIFGAYTYASSAYTRRDGSPYWTSYSMPGPFYLRLTRDGSNSLTYYYSTTGLIWQKIMTYSFTFTPANIGVHIKSSSSTLEWAACADWLRTDV